MALGQDKSTGIALNVTRTRVTVTTINLTIISVMLTIIGGRERAGGQAVSAHLTSSVALFVGFCLTILGLYWLLSSQEWDAQGLSRPRPFTLGAMTTYLALSQTVTAFMHEYLVWIKSAVEAATPRVAESSGLVPLNAFGDTGLPLLLLMGSAIWVLTTYFAPLTMIIKGADLGGRGWVFAAYYFALQVPICWVYAEAWHLQYAPADQPMNMPSLFALQFAQPLLWFR